MPDYIERRSRFMENLNGGKKKDKELKPLFSTGADLTYINYECRSILY